ncbi:hypothetical protein [Streptomyces sp. 8P21H-1]|uniref:hypothetical protein n=1 Tax=Streptomyces sp. 8P21H-1 TaxID=2737048 RepID=UPI00156F0D23|nr:hypothetical protein [Streptomyces sp. 8P21H-1]NSL43175.1 hypothetical protein [Streptomyces sp. 8P21H-1]
MAHGVTAHGRIFRTSVLSCGAAAFALTLTACTSSGDGDGDANRDASRDAAASGLTAAELDLLTRSGNHPRDDAVLHHAETRLIAACMTERGFRYEVDAFVPPSGSPEERQLNLEERRTEGYGLHRQYTTGKPAASPTLSASPESGKRGKRGKSLTNDQYVARLSTEKAAAYMRALRGGKTDLRAMRFGRERTITFSEAGCEAESRKRLFGELDDWAAATYLPQNLNSSLTDVVTADAKYTAAMRDWRTCMAGKGHRYRTPDEAAERLKAEYQEQGATQSLRRREIGVAVADGTCAARLRIPSVVLSLRKQYANSLPEADRSRLRQATRIWTRALDRAGAPD